MRPVEVHCSKCVGGEARLQAGRAANPYMYGRSCESVDETSTASSFSLPPVNMEASRFSHPLQAEQSTSIANFIELQ